MLQYDVAKKLYDEMQERATKMPDDFGELFDEFLQAATTYAATRTAWYFMDREARMEQDHGRSIKHDGYMSLLTAICRNLKITGIDEIMPDRKMKGDFACYLALFLALEQR